ncbi:MAG: GNAT family N-acetyltransferase [Desulfobacterales bacterium]|nr:GNAT family N-acetyltransferase [Desulfobacterales bacterium]
MKINLVKPEKRALNLIWEEGFETRRLVVSLYVCGDAVEMGEVFARPEVWQFAKDITSPDAAARWLEWARLDSFHMPFTLRLKNGALAGFLVVIRRGKGTLELGGWLSPDLWGQGLAKELILEIVRHGRMCGYKKLQAEVNEVHFVAYRLLQASGFSLQGGVWELDI